MSEKLFQGELTINKLRRIFVILLVLIFAIFYWQEISTFLVGFWDFLKYAVSKKAEGDVPKTFTSFFQEFFFFKFFWNVFIDITILLATYYIGLFFISFFVLPIQTFEEIRQTTWRLRLFSTGNVGPIVFVRDGKIHAAEHELESGKRKGPGVALVDYNSAIAIIDHAFKKSKPDESKKAENGGKKKEKIRVEGQGVVFTTESEEIIEDAVDLRVLNRVQGNVEALTRDGIIVVAPVIANFTLGEAPDVIQVSVSEEDDSDDVFLIEHGKKITNIRKLEDLELIQTINFYKKDFLAGLLESETKEQEQTKVSRPEGIEKDLRYVSHVLDPKRIKDAIFFRGRNRGSGDVIRWTELPVNYGIDVYRTEIAKYKFDYLINFGSDAPSPLPGIKNDFAWKMKTAGMLDFQMVLRVDGQEFEKGQEWDENVLYISRPISFTDPTPLRDAGIKIKSATFGTLIPSDPQILERLEDIWISQKDKVAMQLEAQYDLQSNRALTEHKAKTLQDYLQSMGPVFRMKETAFTWRLLQSIQSASENTKDTQFASNLINVLKNWLFADPTTSDANNRDNQANQANQAKQENQANQENPRDEDNAPEQ